jgi:predicted flap endonuclease-1-like 5' DNA nuclease
MEVGLFVFGLLVGVGLTWYLLERARAEETTAREAAFNARVSALQNELAEADAALAETKDRLIALQLEARGVEARAQPLEAELTQAKRAAEQAIEQEMRQRELNAQLRDEIASLKRGGAKAPARKPTETAPPAPASAPAPVEMANSAKADDLTAIKGIGKVIEKKLHELGITSYRQIAAMTPDEAYKVNEAIEFPGRVEREHWIEQARSLARV